MRHLSWGQKGGKPYDRISRSSGKGGFSILGGGVPCSPFMLERGTRSKVGGGFLWDHNHSNSTPLIRVFTMVGGKFGFRARNPKPEEKRVYYGSMAEESESSVTRSWGRKCPSDLPFPMAPKVRVSGSYTHVHRKTSQKSASSTVAFYSDTGKKYFYRWLGGLEIEGFCRDSVYAAPPSTLRRPVESD